MSGEPETIALTPDLAAAVDEAVTSGEFASREEAVGRAVRDWKERRENWGYTIAELRAEIQKGIDSGTAEPFTMDEIKAEARRMLGKRAAAE